MIRFLSAFALLFTMSLGGFALADEAPSADEIAGWVKQLDADEFGARQSAQQKLEAAGDAAVDAVRQAALGKSQEAAVRAIEILKKHVRGDDAAVKEAAAAALKKLAEGDNEIVADRAVGALKPEPEKPDTPDQATPVRPRGVRIPFGGRGGIRIEARTITIGGDGAKKISVKNVDGNKEIEVEEKDRKIKIVESAEGKIKMTITGKEDDMDGSKEVEAESAEDLKKKDPEAHKIYEKYSKGGIGGGRIQFRALPAGPRGIPRIRIAPALPRDVELPDDVEAEIEARFEEALKRIKEVQKQFDGDALPLPEGGAKEKIEALEKMRKQLQEQIEKVQKQIDEAEEE